MWVTKKVQSTQINQQLKSQTKSNTSNRKCLQHWTPPCNTNCQPSPPHINNTIAKPRLKSKKTQQRKISNAYKIGRASTTTTLIPQENEASPVFIDPDHQVESSRRPPKAPWRGRRFNLVRQHRHLACEGSIWQRLKASGAKILQIHYVTRSWFSPISLTWIYPLAPLHSNEATQLENRGKPSTIVSAGRARRTC